MEQTPSSSRRLLFVGIAAVVALIFVIATVAFLLFGLSNRENKANTTPQTDQQVASKDEIKQNLQDLDATIKQAAKDQAAAKAALKDGDNQVKVGN